MKVIYEVWEDTSWLGDGEHWSWVITDKESFLTYGRESRRVLAVAETEADERELEAIYGD